MSRALRMFGALALLSFIASAHVWAQVRTPTTLVMPFDVRERRAAWIGEAASVLIAEELDAMGQPAYSREDRADAFDRLQLPSPRTLSRATVIRVGRLIGAAQVVTGQVDAAGDRLTLRARVIRLDVGQLAPEYVEEGPTASLFDVCARLARKLAPATSAASAPVAPRPPVAAYEFYIHGLLADAPASRIAALEKALSLAPGWSRAQLALWEAYTAAGDDQRALNVALAVKDGDPVHDEARFAAALSYLELKHFDASFGVLATLAGRRQTAAVFNNLGVVQVRRGGMPHNGRATYFFDKAAALDPEEGDYCFNLGYAYWLEKDANAAVYWLQEAVRRDPADADAHASLAAALHALGREPEASRERDLAKRLASRYANVKPGDALPSSLERLESRLIGLPARDLHSLLAAPERRDQRELAAFHLDRGRRLIEQGRDAEALAELRRSVYLSPYEAEPHLLVGRIHLRALRFSEAADALKVSLWSAETAAAHAMLAEVYLEQRDATAARAEAERALVLDPGSADARRIMERLAARPPAR